MNSSKKIMSLNMSKPSKKSKLDPAVWIMTEANRTIIDECEMFFSSTDGEKACEILQHIRSHGWESFLNNPENYVKEIMLEFYANMNETNRTSIVQGKVIYFNSEVLNRLFSLKDVDDSETRAKIKGKDSNFTQEALKVLCPNGVKLTAGTTLNPLTITCSCMVETARTWGKFVSSRLIPYTNTSNYDLKRVMLIHAIQENLPLNVGKLISDEMYKCRFEACECLYFPSTITRLVRSFGVQTDTFYNMVKTCLIGKKYLTSLNSARGLESVEHELNEGENSALAEIEVQEDPNIRSFSVTTSKEIYDSLQHVLKEQAAMRKELDTFVKKQAQKEAVMSAHLVHVTTEITDTKHGQNSMCQTLQNHVASTYPTIYMMGNFLCNLSNAVNCFNVPNFQPDSCENPGSGNFPDVGTSWSQLPGLSTSIPAPLPVVRPFGDQSFTTDVTIIQGFATSSNPSDFLNDEPSVPNSRLVKDDF